MPPVYFLSYAPGTKSSVPERGRLRRLFWNRGNPIRLKVQIDYQ